MNPITQAMEDLHNSHDNGFTPSIDMVLVSSVAGHAAGGHESHDEITLRGRSEAGSRVIVQSGEHRLGTALVNGQGEWSLAMPAQNPGAHCVSVIAVSAYGLEGAVSQTYDITLNGLVTTLSQVAAGQTAQLQDTVNEFAAAENAAFKISDDREAVATGPSVAASSEQHRAEPEMAVTDGMANPADVPVDSAAPVVLEEAVATGVELPQGRVDVAPHASPSLISVLDDTTEGGSAINSGEATFDRTPTLRGSGEAGSRVLIYSNAEEIGETWVDDSGSWSFTPTELAFGEHQISVVAIDLAGAISAPSPPFLIVIENPLFVGGRPVIEPVNDAPLMTTWDQLADGELPLPVVTPRPGMILEPVEQTFDFSLIAQPLIEVSRTVDAAPTLSIGQLLTQDGSELFQHLDSGLEQMQIPSDETLLATELESTWADIDVVSTEGVAHTVAPVTQLQLESDDNGFTPLI